MYIHVYINTAFQNTSIVIGISFRHVLYFEDIISSYCFVFFSDFIVISSLEIVKRVVIVIV